MRIKSREKRDISLKNRLKILERITKINIKRSDT